MRCVLKQRANISKGNMVVSNNNTLFFLLKKGIFISYKVDPSSIRPSVHPASTQYIVGFMQCVPLCLMKLGIG